MNSLDANMDSMDELYVYVSKILGNNTHIVYPYGLHNIQLVICDHRNTSAEYDLGECLNYSELKLNFKKKIIYLSIYFFRGESHF